MSSEHIAVHLQQRPEGNIVPGETFAIRKHPSPTPAELQDGDVVLESLYLSLDPGMRGWLDDVPSYIPPVAIGEIMRGHVLGRVTASRSQKFPVGSYAFTMMGWTEKGIANEESLQAVPTPDPTDGGRLTDYLSVLGFTGITAYVGMVEVGNVKPGDFVVVSGAAGAVGSIAGQIAKIHGATVYGITGSDEKCRWLVDDLKFDGALNYKSEDFAQKFKGLTEGKIDIFYDNVGGEVLDLALLCANKNARFVMCGGVSQYNEKEVQGPKNYTMLWTMRIRMEGFLIFDHLDKIPEVRRKLSQWLVEGRLQRRETIVRGGLSQAETALMQLYHGMNTGKLLVEVKAP
ncbi:Alcohol dehydrogenase C-terminal [Penicillium samsonianum]|uniref:Alcohol dehydrogenase C-terminal n=1 Tax=Penicillium samsonianum TaxID=1882272 RepID=UPI002546BE88|nr:Alcohol dehydrogenase C-terminal [Penicillium samsonianum]KAJ6133257.1 Alcohol dehydrogenase C-terminal [Penicillium samsonianum]